METPKTMAQHFRQAFFGGNWTWVNVKDILAGATWQQAIARREGFNTIGALAYHIGYFVSAVLRVLQGEPINAHDKYSFDHPPIQSQQDWEALLAKTWAEAETLANLIEQLPESRLGETFVEEKYGTYYRNLHGLIEHTHYHLGQIVILKKLLQQHQRE